MNTRFTATIARAVAMLPAMALTKLVDGLSESHSPGEGSHRPMSAGVSGMGRMKLTQATAVATIVSSHANPRERRKSVRRCSGRVTSRYLGASSGRGLCRGANISLRSLCLRSIGSCGRGLRLCPSERADRYYAATGGDKASVITAACAGMESDAVAYGVEAGDLLALGYDPG